MVNKGQKEKGRGGILEGNKEVSTGVPVLRKVVRTSSSDILTLLSSSG